MSEICISFRLFLSTILVCCVGYPLIVLVYAQAVFPENSKGSLLTNSQGKLIGSKLIAQEFTELKYFWSRPSAVDYNASGAGGSNLSPTNPRITDRASVLIDRYNLASGEKLTADLVTTSGSGLDPHITLTAARLQLSRVAEARRMPVHIVEELVKQRRDSPTLTAIGGEPLINVLLLNLALDRYQEGN